MKPTGPLGDGVPHPRSYGTFPRVLGHYVRERGIISLETAVHKMTGQPAARLDLEDRGVLKEGVWADLTVFDPDTVAQGGSFVDPDVYPVGIQYVMVNGEFVVKGHPACDQLLEAERPPSIVTDRCVELYWSIMIDLLDSIPRIINCDVIQFCCSHLSFRWEDHKVNRTHFFRTWRNTMSKPDSH
ncbi:amidohydrolase family protein [Saliphagus sp. GCM10025317]